MSNKVSDKISDIKARQASMEAKRANFDSIWSEISSLVLPSADSFNQKRKQPGQKDSSRIFDATPQDANEKFAAAINSLITPANSRWHKLTSNNPELDDRQDVRSYFDQVEDILFAERYNPMANFQPNMMEMYLNIGALGNGTIFVGERKRKYGRNEGIFYRHIPLSQTYFEEDEAGLIDFVHRKVQMTRRQVMQKFPLENMPKNFEREAKDRPFELVDLIHVVAPNEEFDPQMMNAKGMPYSSIWVLCSEDHILDESGFHSFPYGIGRLLTAYGEVYARGPGWKSLPDIKMLQEMMKTLIRTAQLIANPPLLAAARGIIPGFNALPGVINHGAMSANGTPLVQSLDTRANLPVTMELINSVRTMINSAFLVTLFQILVDAPKMTATEVLQRAQEKGELLAPMVSRLQSEQLGRTVEREIDILSRQGKLPPMPEALEQARGEYKITYTSPINQAQKADQGLSILRLMEATATAASLNPKAINVIDVQKGLRELAKILAAPADMIVDEEIVSQMEQSQDEELAASQALAATDALSSQALNMARAQKESSLSPSPILGIPQ